MQQCRKERDCFNDSKQIQIMIRITDKSRCTGCTACVTACPAQCIVMRRDRQGFDYPVANPDLCLNCGKCDSICPVPKSAESRDSLAAFAVRVPEYVDQCSSGGVFPKLAEDVIKADGVVYGAILQDDMTVGHTDVWNSEGLKKMRGSKYVQSDLYSVFEEIADNLKDGVKVMFTGTPCQIAGLNSYLGKDYENLLTVEVACHGVPSPGLWENYLRAVEKKYGGKVTDVRFRDKSKGWRHYSFVMEIEGKGKVAVPYMKDPYMALFVQDMILRPSCYECRFVKGISGADITLADLWNVREVAPSMNDDKGVSLVIANSEKGLESLCGMDLQSVDYHTAIKENGGFVPVKAIPQRRDEFFQGYGSAKDLPAYMKGFVVRKPLHIVIYRTLRSCLSGLKRRIVR